MRSHTTIPQDIMLSVNLHSLGGLAYCLREVTRTVRRIYVWSLGVCIGYIMMHPYDEDSGRIGARRRKAIHEFFSGSAYVYCAQQFAAEVYFCLPPPGSSGSSDSVGPRSECFFLWTRR